MGLASALTTALTGLSAAETTIDVVGNNVANANTVGFKASEAVFSTQFVQTRSLGSSPTADSGGTNPRQIGLGTKVAEIKPIFTQGTIEVSASASDLAIQGDGFFIVQGPQGEQLFTRNGIFKTNANNELVTVGGNRVLGYGVDDNFQVERTVLVPLTIPLGSQMVSQATQNVFFEGTLRPNGALANTASVIRSDLLTDGSFPFPSTNFGNTPFAVAGPNAGPTLAVGAGGAQTAGVYEYVVVYTDAQGNESPPSASATITLADGESVDVTFGDTPPPGGGPAEYTGRRVYRRYDDGSGFGDYYLVADFAGDLVTTSFNDALDQASIEPPAPGARRLDAEAQPPGVRSYSYRITFAHSLGSLPETKPSPILGGSSISVTGDNRIKLTGLPGLADMPPGYDQIRVYRTIDGNDEEYYLLTTLDPVPSGNTEYIDGKTDSFLTTQPRLNFNGPAITPSTRLLDLQKLTPSNTYESLFPEEGELTFIGRKGGRTLTAKTLQITATSTVQDLINFMEMALGIQENTDPVNPIPNSLFGITTISPGGSVVDGRIQLVGNNGTDNAIDVSLSGLRFRGNSGQLSTVNMPFGSIQQAQGESAVADFVVFDSLGVPISVRVTVVLEARDSASTTYRWFADSPDNQPADGSARIAVGTGLIRFDSQGNVINVTESTVSVDRNQISSASPLQFELDFTQLSGLADSRSSLAASQQDGSPPGTLSSFIIGEDGRIRGVFSNGVTRDLGQVVLARFANNAGLEQKGENLFAAGVNSGLPILGDPGQQGIGRIIAGAVELSTSDIGSNLIDLILASTMYRGNARVIDAAQRLFDELLNLRR
jgi:flagellar hook protein FlgE